MPNDLKKFREAGVDAFTGGFQVRAPRSYARKPQIWANSTLEIQKVLLTAFPTQATNPKQRTRAGRWLRVIHLYHRLGYTRAQVAADMTISSEQVKAIVRAITRTRKGLTWKGKKRGLRKVGRPKSAPLNSRAMKVAQMPSQKGQ